MTIGNIGGGGLMAAVTGVMVQNLSPMRSALLLGVAVLLPTSVFPWMQAPGPDRRLARESFPQFFAEVTALLKRREVLIAIMLFVSPAASFTLTNFLSGLGNDFHATIAFVGMVGGGGVLGSAASAAASAFRLFEGLLPLPIPLSRHRGRRGSIFTLTLISAAVHAPDIRSGADR